MTKTEIKKAIYKEKPMATLTHIKDGSAYYTTKLESGEVITFNIPVNDMGTASFYSEIEAKLLNRWISL